MHAAKRHPPSKQMEHSSISKVKTDIREMVSRAISLLLSSFPKAVKPMPFLGQSPSTESSSTGFQNKIGPVFKQINIPFSTDSLPGTRSLQAYLNRQADMEIKKEYLQFTKMSVPAPLFLKQKPAKRTL